MKIETKFNPNDKRWVMHCNRPKMVEVSSVQTFCYETEDGTTHISIYYGVYLDSDEKRFSEEEFENKTFATKADLLASL